MSVSTLPPATCQTVDAAIYATLQTPGGKLSFQSMLLAGGFSYPPGTVLGLATSGAYAGKCILADPTAIDGSQTPVGLMLEAVNTFDQNGAPLDMSVSVAVTGSFNPNCINYSAGWTMAAMQEALRAINITTTKPSFSS